MDERRLHGLKIGFVGLLVAAAGFGLSFLIEPLGWMLMIVGFITALAGGAVHTFMVFAQLRDFAKGKDERSAKND